MLRPYQKDAKEKIKEAFSEFDRVLIILGTSLGKTIIFNSLAEEYIKEGKRVLVLAHRDELLGQAAEKMREFNNIEHTLIKANEKTDHTKLYHVGSVQSLCKESRLNKYPADYFSLLVIDESHHTQAQTYRTIIDHFKGAKVLGVTATPGEESKLAGIFQTTAFNYPMEEAIKDGWCARVIQRTASISVDLSHIKNVAGDFAVGELDEAVVKKISEVADYIKKHLQYRKKIMIFTPRIASAQIMASLLRENGLDADYVCGVSKDRQEKLERFKNGDLRIIASSSLLLEGYDNPAVDCIINLRPTQSEILMKQMLGRGTRLFKGKDNLLVVDLLWGTKKEILNACDSFARTTSVASSMKSFLTIHTNKSYDLSDLEKYIYLVMGNIAIKENARLIAVKDMTSRGLIDYRTFAFITDNWAILGHNDIYDWQKLSITEKQKEFLELKCGISAKGMTKGLASAIINAILKRIDSKLCTIKQMLFLAKRGCFDKSSETTMAEASAIIDRAAKCSWQIPRDIQLKIKGSKRLETPLVNLNDLKINEVKEGEKECSEDPF